MIQDPIAGTVEETRWIDTGIVEFVISNDDGMFVETYTFEEVEKLEEHSLK